MNHAEMLIQHNILAHTVSGQCAQHMVATAHERTIRSLCQVIAQYRGTHALAQAGCRIFEFSLGDARVLVEGEYTPEEGDGWNEPHHAASWAVIQVLINGAWCDATDCVPEEVLERWEQQMHDTLEEERGDVSAAAVEAYEARREWVEA